MKSQVQPGLKLHHGTPARGPYCSSEMDIFPFSRQGKEIRDDRIKKTVIGVSLMIYCFVCRMHLLTDGLSISEHNRSSSGRCAIWIIAFLNGLLKTGF